MPNLKNIYIIFFFFLMGMGSTITQSILFREFLVLFYGNELVLGFILFAWLFSITIGALVFNPVNHKIKNPEQLFLYMAFLFSMLPYFLIPVIRVSRGFMGIGYGLFIPFTKMAVLTCMVIFLPAFIIGFTFPLGCRILTGKTSVSKIFIAESAGSLAGGVIFSFILIKFFTTPLIAGIFMSLFTLTIILYVNTVYNIGAISNFQSSDHSFKLPTSWIRYLKSALLILISIIFLVAAKNIDRFTINARWKTLIKEMPLIASTDSPYQNLAITKQADQYSVYFNGTYGFSFPDPYGEAMNAHHLLTQCPDPEEVLILGGATPGFIKECLKQPLVKKITCVYVDAALYKLMYPYLQPDEKAVLKDKRVDLVFSDGRVFVKSSVKRFDLVYLNLPDPSTALMNRYYTLDFFREVVEVLKPKGVVALHLSSAENYLGSDILEYNTSIYNTLRSVFPHIAISPSTPTYFFASREKNTSTDDSRELFLRYNSRKVKKTTFTPYLFEVLYEPSRVRFKRDFLERSNDSPLNTDLSPIAYLYNIKLWDRYSDSKLAGVITFMERYGIRFWSVISIAVICLFLVYLFAFKSQKFQSFDTCSLFTVFTTGFAAMGMSIILMFAYQNLYSCLFEKIGFLIALFMLGLAVGGGISHYLIKQNRANLRYLILIQIFITVLAASLPQIVESFEKLPSGLVKLFYLLIAGTGALTGQVFPMAAVLMARKGNDIDKATAKVDAADHLGGCIGALLMGSLLVPLLGVFHSSLLLAVIEATALALWLIYYIYFSMQDRKVKT